MIVGSGLLAQAFSLTYAERDDVCIYAAGVSNSGCSDEHEFERERLRLSAALEQAQHADAFVYFSTCSIGDPEALGTPYVLHKLAMERLVAVHPRHLILRLPQVAGKTPNPHTLLNFLYGRISRSEAFPLWIHAGRNIIDVDDVVTIAACLIDDSSARNITMNIANPVSYTMPDIVAAMERVIGKRAIYNAAPRGADYAIDTRAMLPLLGQAAVKFGDDYLERVLEKYYGKSH